MIRSLLTLATVVTAFSALSAQAQAQPMTPVLRANVVVSGDVVRIGDVVEHAGDAARIAIFRAPDRGTTGSVPVEQLMEALRAHQVFGVDAGRLHAVSVTRAVRTVTRAEIEAAIVQALERRNGLGDARDLALTFDHALDTIELDAANTGALRAGDVRLDPRSHRFDVTFEIASTKNTAPARLRFTGVAVDMIETAVLARDVERGSILKSSDVVLERRPRADIGRDGLERTQAINMQTRRSLRAGQPLRMADLNKPDLVKRGESVTLIYQSGGLYLTIRGKALENGTEGDTVGVLNLSSKREVTGTVIANGQVAATSHTVSHAMHATPRFASATSSSTRPITE